MDLASIQTWPDPTLKDLAWLWIKCQQGYAQLILQYSPRIDSLTSAHRVKAKWFVPGYFYWQSYVLFRCYPSKTVLFSVIYQQHYKHSAWSESNRYQDVTLEQYYKQITKCSFYHPLACTCIQWCCQSNVCLSGCLVWLWWILITYVGWATWNFNTRDNIPPELLKCTLDPVSKALHGLFCAVWRCGKIPAEWKEGIIASLYKGKGPRNQCGSHRPITLLSVLGKVFAHILLARLDPLLQKHRRPHQSGFTCCRSTLDAILALRLLVAVSYTHLTLPTNREV